jgi:hypothetical protein
MQSRNRCMDSGQKCYAFFSDALLIVLFSSAPGSRLSANGTAWVVNGPLDWENQT